MVSLMFHDEHLAWQQRVQKEINEAFKFQNSYAEPLRPCFSPPKVNQTRPKFKSRAKSVVYSALPSSNVNLAAMNVYAEVRGKYSRNANKTLNCIPKIAGIVSRPSTAGSLISKTRRSQEMSNEKVQKNNEKLQKNNEKLQKNNEKLQKDSEKEEKYNEKERKDKRPFNEDSFKLKVGKKNEYDEEEEGKNDEVEDVGEDEGSLGIEDQEKNEEIEDKKTDFSARTSSSQQRYIEELERLLREERIKRIKVEEKLEKLTSKKSRRNVKILDN